MEKVRVFTDSCSDLPEKVLKEYNIHMVPTPVHFGNRDFLDRGDLEPADFYCKLDQEAELPKTSQINPGVFVQKFSRALDEGYKVLSINFSSKLSGIFNSAVLAKETIGSENIYVIDSRSASVGFGLSVLKAAHWLKAGKDLEKVIELTLDHCSRMEHIFAVGSLEMLKRGGRISKTSALVGNVLKIKPVLHFQDGEILPLTKVRGKKKMLDYLVDIMEDRGDRIGEQEIIGINHSANPALAEKVKLMIQKRYGNSNFLVSEIGAAIGSHVGKDTVSVFFLNRDKIAEAEVR